MENWGLIKYRETKLLLKEGETSSSSKEGIAKLVAHEVGHQVSFALQSSNSCGHALACEVRTYIPMGENEKTVWSQPARNITTPTVMLCSRATTGNNIPKTVRL